MARRSVWTLWVGLWGVLLLAACGRPNTTLAPSARPMEPLASGSGETYREITAPELQAMLQTKDFLLINVHVPFAGNIPNTDLSIPFNEIAQHANQLPQDKEAKIVVYCRSGSMSAVAARTLVQMGYTNVWNLTGGMNAWRQAGFPLELTP